MGPIWVFWVTRVVSDIDKGTIYEFGNASAQRSEGGLGRMRLRIRTTLFLKKFLLISKNTHEVSRTDDRSN